jgi:hypothetical protein
MTHDEHKARHKALDDAVLELWADYVRHYPRALPQDTTVGQLITWNLGQLREPTEAGPHTVHSYAVCAHCGESITEPAATHMCAAERMEHDR